MYGHFFFKYFKRTSQKDPKLMGKKKKGKKKGEWKIPIKTKRKKKTKGRHPKKKNEQWNKFNKKIQTVK